MRMPHGYWKAGASFLLLSNCVLLGSALSSSVGHLPPSGVPLLTDAFPCYCLPPGRKWSGMESSHTFLYFAYGSNMLKERLRLRNPSAIVHCVARLKDYKVVFGNYKGLANERWHGGVATVEHSPGDEVWGVVWKMHTSDLKSLDHQEGVMQGAYSPVELCVGTKGQEIKCRTYVMNSCVYAPPSPQYLQVIVMGAAQNGLPKYYQEKLRAIKTNQYFGPLPIMSELEAKRRAKED